MRCSRGRLVKVAKEALRANVLPTIENEGGAVTCGFVLSILQKLDAREKRGLKTIVTYFGRIDSLAEESVDLLSDIDLPDEVERADLHAIREAVSVAENYDDWMDEYDKLLRLLQHMARILAGNRDRLAEKDLAHRFEDLFRRMAESDVSLQRALRSACADESDDGHEPAAEPWVTEESLAVYLGTRFPDRRALRVSGLSRPGFGLSKETYLFNLSNNGGPEESLVMRRMPESPHLEVGAFNIEIEYEGVKAIHEAGLPVPEPLWLETGDTLGARFMVMKRVKGVQAGDPFKAYCHLDEEFYLDAAQFLARLHNLSLDHFGGFADKMGISGVGGMTRNDAVGWWMRTWDEFLEKHGNFPSPAQAYIFDWLYQNIPESKLPPVIVHGDFNIHNILIDGGLISSVLDWEVVHFGDPAEDLMNLRPHVLEHYDWEKFLIHYMKSGGKPVDETHFPFFQCLQNAIWAKGANKYAYQMEMGETDLITAAIALDVSRGFQEVAWNAISEKRKKEANT